MSNPGAITKAASGQLIYFSRDENPGFEPSPRSRGRAHESRVTGMSNPGAITKAASGQLISLSQDENLRFIFFMAAISLLNACSPGNFQPKKKSILASPSSNSWYKEPKEPKYVELL
jgi:hypothetical protein